MMGELAGTVITSMEVAQMVEKRHADLLKDIRRYVEQLAGVNFHLGVFYKWVLTSNALKCIICLTRYKWR